MPPPPGRADPQLTLDGGLEHRVGPIRLHSLISDELADQIARLDDFGEIRANVTPPRSHSLASRTGRADTFPASPGLLRGWQRTVTRLDRDGARARDVAATRTALFVLARPSRDLTWFLTCHG